MTRVGIGILAVVLALAGVSCNDSGNGRSSTNGNGPVVERLHVEVIAKFPHDTNAFTQGLLLDNGRFFESTGQYGQSDLREVIPETGEVVREQALTSSTFGEGLTLWHDSLIQITWKKNTAFVYDQGTFTQQTTFHYAGEGWGICHDDKRLIMSDGSSTLFFRNPETFEVINQVTVKRSGVPISKLNELEFVDGQIYANVWQTNEILRIDPTNGEVTAVIDASGLLTAEESRKANVLNGIAWTPRTGHFYITGKLWPWVFEVRFVE